MKTHLFLACALASLSATAQYQSSTSPLDGRNHGVVMDHPDLKNVVVKPDVPYLTTTAGSLKVDIFQPPTLKAGEKRPVVVFLNAIGDEPGNTWPIKNWGIYQSWPRLMAAQGFVGVAMDADQNKVQESLRGVFDFLEKQGAAYGIDAERVGVYAASANVTGAARYLMSDQAHRGIRAAVLYYGRSPEGPFRKDLPVLFVVAEGDVARSGYGPLWGEVLKNNAPWTITMASNQPHAFDAFANTDDARKVIRQTISFWKDHLEPVPPFADPQPLARDILAAGYGGKQAKAAELLHAWTTQHPDDALGLSRYAGMLRDLKRYPEAEQTYQKLLTLQPKNGEALTGLATVAYLTDKPAEAEAYVKKAVEVGGESRDLYVPLAFRLLASGKFRESIPYYQKAIALQPNGNDYYNLACAHALLNEKEPALTALEQAVKLGYGSKSQFDADPDLASVRAEERYKNLFSLSN
jgi:hypothetical protein